MRKSSKFKGAYKLERGHAFLNEGELVKKDGYEYVKVQYVFYNRKWYQDEFYLNRGTFDVLYKDIDKNWISEIGEKEIKKGKTFYKIGEVL